MPLITCPGCGKQISDAAPACIHCGMPRGAAMGGAAAVPVRGGTPAWVILLIVVAVLFVFVFIVGILAAIAIPKFAGVAKQAQEAEAATLLRDVLGREQKYHRTAGVYTADLGRLEAGPKGAFYTLSVTRASHSQLCVEATPRPEFASYRLSSQSIDETGWLFGAAGCVEPEDEAADVTADTLLGAPGDPAEEPADEASSEEGPAAAGKPHKP
jgi:Tfp pilus assembly protein PilE